MNDEHPKARKEQVMELKVGYMPEGHTVVGYIAYIKMLDKEGECYWASRSEDLNAMEQLGMAYDQLDEYRTDMGKTRVDQDGSDG